jgi:hypothetical protein
MADSIPPSQDKKRLKNGYLTKWLNEVEKLIFNPWFTNPWLNL